MSTPLGTADMAVTLILRAWWLTLAQSEDVWNAALRKFPAEIRARARLYFLDRDNGKMVIGGYPRVDEKPPLVAVVLLNESPDQEYMGQGVGLVASYSNPAEFMEEIGNITVSNVGIMVLAESDEIGHVYSELVRIGCMIAERRMLEAGFANFLFVEASDLAPEGMYLPKDYWIRTYTYSVLEQNEASMTLPDGQYVPAVVEIFLKRIIEIEPTLNTNGVVPTTEV